VHEIFSSILAVEEECLGKEISVTEMLELIVTVNSVANRIESHFAVLPT